MSNKKEENSIKPIIKGPSLGYTDNFSKRELWKEIANEQNGEFKIKFNSGKELEIHTLTIPYKKWNIEVSVSGSRPLKFRISFEAGQDFEFTLSWADYLERIMNKFSKSKVELGWKEFDKQYLIKSNRSDLVKRLLTIISN